jgi:hypothetical protein
MKNCYALKTVALSAICLLSLSSSLHAQAFRKGSFILSLSEGWTNSIYTTTDLSGRRSETGKQGEIIGVRDPITLEYGITRHWGIGLSSGSDFYYLDPSLYYGFSTGTSKAKATTSEFTLNGSYHFYVSRHSDLSLIASFGGSSVSLTNTDRDHPYQYTASGNVLRLAAHARYYPRKHFGFMGMASAFTSNASPAKVKGNTVALTTSTGISGFALEFGLCFRFTK